MASGSIPWRRWQCRRKAAFAGFAEEIATPQWTIARLPLILFMKTFVLILSAVVTLALGACSRSDEAGKTTVASPTPNPNLQKDAERLQQATANIAKERERAAQSSPTPTP